jgi:hypothetical protein
VAAGGGQAGEGVGGVALVDEVRTVLADGPRQPTVRDGVVGELHGLASRQRQAGRGAGGEPGEAPRLAARLVRFGLGPGFHQGHLAHVVAAQPEGPLDLGDVDALRVAGPRAVVVEDLHGTTSAFS